LPEVVDNTIALIKKCVLSKNKKIFSAGVENLKKSILSFGKPLKPFIMDIMIVLEERKNVFNRTEIEEVQKLVEKVYQS